MGYRVVTLGDQIDGDTIDSLQAERCATVSGFSVHANVSINAYDRKRLERLIRYASRPAVSTERLSELPDGRLLYSLKKVAQWNNRDRFERADFMAKLAAGSGSADAPGHKFSGPGYYPRPQSLPQYYAGDAAQLRAILKHRNYSEVRLFSNGGDLNEGVELGLVLREAQATVRVYGTNACISACTVAFMGGLFRFVDKGATYQVHAYSKYRNGLPPELVNRMRFDPEGELKRFAVEELRGEMGARFWAQRLFAYFQAGVLPLGAGTPNTARLKRWLQEQTSLPGYLKSEKLKEDAERIRIEGEPAAQEIVMRIERDCMEQAVNELRPLLPELGPRVEPALNMLETMFSSRIMMTASLSQETLLRMGYITKIIEP